MGGRRKRSRSNHGFEARVRSLSLLLAVIASLLVIPTPSVAETPIAQEISTRLVKDINAGPGSSFQGALTDVGGTLFFAARENFTSGLWTSDGTDSGTTRVKTFVGAPYFLTNVGGTVFFVANDGVNGTELWKSDGTEAGTVLVKDITPGATPSYPESLVASGNTLFFTVEVPGNSPARQLWKSDGTEAGTVFIKQISVFVNGEGWSRMSNLTNVDGTIFFTANDGSGVELWKSNGTEAGTVRVEDINAGAGSSSPWLFHPVGGVLYFWANDGTSGMELWRSDGTEAGTWRVKDINPGAGSSGSNNIIHVGSTLFFSANDGTHGHELWSSDGTTEGTDLVVDLAPGATSSQPYGLKGFGGEVFFTPTGFLDFRYELWKSDGTAAGTVLVKDIDPNGTSLPEQFTEWNGTLLFTANDGAHGPELWRSDGTTEGTRIVEDINPGTTGSPPMLLTPVGESLFFSADDGSSGQELWGAFPAFVLTAQNAGSGAGKIVSTPEGIDCGTDCSEIYETGSEVTLVASPEPGSAFVGWSGACTGENPCVISMTETRSATATFTQLPTGGSITIQLDNTAPSDASFPYSSGLGSFNLVDDGNDPSKASKNFAPLDPGTFSFQQANVKGWAITDISCTGATSSATKLKSRTATVTIDSDDEVVCVFGNAPAPSKGGGKPPR